ncbi:MAG TPA: hypothetical protein VEI53_08585, partial [Ktedonobacteraceae bacterium]|nr:hypothetical protein [Ktedonobacteraceae bacterium]
MQQCKSCGAKLPIHARFCGFCGQVLDASGELRTAPGGASDADFRSIDISTVQSSPTYPASMNVEQTPQELDAPFRNIASENEPTVQSSPSGENESDDRATPLPDLLLPWMSERQTSPINVPHVQGTPQPGGVPTVEGTPATPNTPPAGQASLQNPAPSSSAPPHAPSWSIQVRQKQQIRGTHRVPPQQHHQPASSPHHPTSRPTHQPPRSERHSGQLPGHHTRKPTHHLHSGKLHRPHLRNTTANLLANPVSKWILLIVAAIVVLVGSGFGFILARMPSPPVLSLSGSSSVTPGSVLSVHGSGFSSGGTVALSRDQGSSLLAGDGTTLGNHSFAGQANAALALLLPSNGQSNARSITVKVRNDGTFDANIVVRGDWFPGSHTIHATDENSSRTANREFTIIPMPAKLTVSSALLDFGKLERGNKPVRSVAVMNTGQQRLTWSADIGSTSWLKLQSKAGAIELNGSQEFIYVTADTSSLHVGSYSGTLRIKSNGGNALVTVQLQIVSSVPQQARLAVTPNILDFGQLQTGQQSTLNLAVDNGGTDVLNWSANTGNTSWLSLYPNTGIVRPGAVPQTIQVTANTANLLQGNYSATLQISSNGGILSVQVVLVVPRLQSPPQPKPVPPALLASPYSFSTPGDSNCAYQANTGWICTAWLSSYNSAQTNLNWSASSNIGGVTFTPSHGALSPGQTTKVIIAIPNRICPTQAAFTFKGPRNSADVLWFCRAPTWTFSPGMFIAEKDCQASASAGWTCTGVLAETPGSEGKL